MSCKNTNETGLTMVEILGVLALIGFLSMMTLYGYQYAIYRYRVAQTLHQISVVLAATKTINLENIPETELEKDTNGNTYIPVQYVISDVKFKEDDPYHFVTPLNAEVGVYRDANGVWRTQIEYTDQMDFGDCRALVLSSLAEKGIGYNGQVLTQEQLREDEILLKEVCDYYTSSDA